ncbi:hypothetical protein ABS764_02590 [Flavobacterium sp. ST-87]|uniref:Uncharacterized protein n=1 Tax=Flavobacterium plantiphilum TaxID=3163297 RepID=A0ABW8XR97_9FLAO
MKNAVLTIFVSVLFYGCSSEEVTAIDPNLDFKSLSIPPANKANPYDAVGAQYGKALAAYYENNSAVLAQEEVESQMDFDSSNRNASDVTKRTTITYAPEAVIQFVDDPEGGLHHYLDMENISVAAKSYLHSFYTYLIAEQQEEYPVLYNYIVDYETSISADNSLLEDESQLLLETTSVTRYALYVASRHIDRDWELATANKSRRIKTSRFEMVLLTAFIQILDY